VETVIPYCRLLSQHVIGRTEENHETLPSEQPVAYWNMNMRLRFYARFKFDCLIKRSLTINKTGAGSYRAG